MKRLIAEIDAEKNRFSHGEQIPPYGVIRRDIMFQYPGEHSEFDSPEGSLRCEYGDSALSPLKQRISEIFLSRYVPDLPKLKLTLDVIDRLQTDPDLENEYMDMLEHDIPESHPSFPDNDLYRTRVQTARAVQFARDYMDHLLELDDPSPYIDRRKIHRRIARLRIDMFRHIRRDERLVRLLQDPDSIIFSGTKDRDDSREKITINAGHASPRQEWTGEKRAEIQEALRTANWQEKNPPEVWGAPPENFPQVRYILDLSSLPLFYRGQRLKSFEVIQYARREAKPIASEDDQSIVSEEAQSITSGEAKPTASEEAQSITSGETKPIASETMDKIHELMGYEIKEAQSITTEDIGYVTSKLTTDKSSYYTSEADEKQQSIGFRTIELVSPFLSGTQFEKDTTALEGKMLAESYWKNKDDDWRFSEDNYKAYYELIHPAIAHYTLSVIKHLALRGKKEVTILDIAGGNGDLAERIIKDIQKDFPELKITYKLVDFSRGDVDLANERFRRLDSEQVKASAIERDMYAYDFDAEQMKRDLGLPQEGVDIVINSGGLLNRTVTRDVKDPVLFNCMYAELGAFGISSGHTAVSICASHHKKNDMDIRNLYDERSGRQMYVVRRREKPSAAFYQRIEDLKMRGKNLSKDRNILAKDTKNFVNDIANLKTCLERLYSEQVRRDEEEIRRRKQIQENLSGFDLKGWNERVTRWEKKYTQLKDNVKEWTDKYRKMKVLGSNLVDLQRREWMSDDLEDGLEGIRGEFREMELEVYEGRTAIADMACRLRLDGRRLAGNHRNDDYGDCNIHIFIGDKT